MFRTLHNFVFKDKRVLVRLDIDVPLNNDGSISDDFRLKKAVPTLNFLKDEGAAQIVMIGHIGRPENNDSSLKTDVVADRFEELLGEKVLKLDNCVDLEIPKEFRFVMLENLRFHKDEEKNDEVFSKKLASFGDLFVLEAFAVSHRRHASIIGVQKFLPSCAGFQLEKEINSLDISESEHPVVAILGAAKIHDKIKLVSKLLEKVDTMILGGAIIFTFYKAKGFEVGKSLVDDSSLEFARQLSENKKIILPIDIVVANEISENAKTLNVKFNEIPKEYIGLDIGEETIANYKNILKNAKTIVWNGPMGKFEVKKFEKGTKDLAEFIITLKAKSIVGGGDTANAVQSFGFEDKFTHVSTGGGASLQLLEGDTLPGIIALEENAKKFE